MDRPILFSTPMVRAILDGRKTQTRRIVKPQPVSFVKQFTSGMWGRHLPNFDRDGSTYFEGFKCPYGEPGDRLWVRETWCWGTNTEFQCKFPHKVFPDNQSSIALYRADAATLDWINESDAHHNSKRKWKPSIHMPRWASRLTLEITEVRVQRLQDISTWDAESEGVGWELQQRYGDCRKEGETQNQAIFRELWESINGKGSWGANPWVWVITFRTPPATESTEKL